ncbi:MAG: hypothetical protein ACREGD_04955, partial [Candidatus Saccharimonadales bacterium]
MPKFEGSGGVVWTLDPPYSEAIQAQITRQELVEIVYEKPAPTADREDWAAYLEQAHDVPREQTRGLS